MFKRALRIPCAVFVNRVEARYDAKLGPAYNKFGYNEHSAIMSRFLCTIMINSNAKKFSYNEHPPTTNSFFSIFLLVLSGTQCNWIAKFASRISHCEGELIAEVS